MIKQSIIYLLFTVSLFANMLNTKDVSIIDIGTVSGYREVETPKEIVQDVNIYTLVENSIKYKKRKVSLGGCFIDDNNIESCLIGEHECLAHYDYKNSDTIEMNSTVYDFTSLVLYEKDAKKLCKVCFDNSGWDCTNGNGCCIAEAGGSCNPVRTDSWAQNNCPRFYNTHLNSSGDIVREKVWGTTDFKVWVDSNCNVVKVKRKNIDTFNAYIYCVFLLYYSDDDYCNFQAMQDKTDDIYYIIDTSLNKTASMIYYDCPDDYVSNGTKCNKYDCPDDYVSNGTKCVKQYTYSFYEYRCNEQGYIPLDKGLEKCDKIDPDGNIQNLELANSCNPATPPPNNCVKTTWINPLNKPCAYKAEYINKYLKLSPFDISGEYKSWENNKLRGFECTENPTEQCQFGIAKIEAKENQLCFTDTHGYKECLNIADGSGCNISGVIGDLSKPIQYLYSSSDGKFLYSDLNQSSNFIKTDCFFNAKVGFRDTSPGIISVKADKNTISFWNSYTRGSVGFINIIPKISELKQTDTLLHTDFEDRPLIGAKDNALSGASSDTLFLSGSNQIGSGLYGYGLELMSETNNHYKPSEDIAFIKPSRYFSIWFNPAQSSGTLVYSKDYIDLSLENGKVCLSIGDSNSICTNNEVKPNQWNNIVINFDENMEAKLYLNAVETNITIGFNDKELIDNLYIGHKDGGVDFVGKVDNIEIGLGIYKESDLKSFELINADLKKFIQYPYPDIAKLLEKNFTGFYRGSNGFVYAVSNEKITGQECLDRIKDTDFSIAVANDDTEQEILNKVSFSYLHSNYYLGLDQLDYCIIESKNTYNELFEDIEYIKFPVKNDSEFINKYVYSDYDCHNHLCGVAQCPDNTDPRLLMQQDRYILDDPTYCLSESCEYGDKYFDYCGEKSGCPAGNNIVSSVSKIKDDFFVKISSCGIDTKECQDHEFGYVDINNNRYIGNEFWNFVVLDGNGVVRYVKSFKFNTQDDRLEILNELSNLKDDDYLIVFSYGDPSVIKSFPELIDELSKLGASKEILLNLSYRGSYYYIGYGGKPLEEKSGRRFTKEIFTSINIGGSSSSTKCYEISCNPGSVYNNEKKQCVKLKCNANSYSKDGKCFSKIAY